MRNFLLCLAAIALSVAITTYSIDYVVDLRGGDLCQLALDKHYVGRKPYIRHWNLTKKIGEEKLYLVEFQFGTENDNPHVTWVIVKPNLRSKVIGIQ
jgi:hypothetical protein